MKLQYLLLSFGLLLSLSCNDDDNVIETPPPTIETDLTCTWNGDVWEPAGAFAAFVPNPNGEYDSVNGFFRITAVKKSLPEFNQLISISAFGVLDTGIPDTTFITISDNVNFCSNVHSEDSSTQSSLIITEINDSIGYIRGEFELTGIDTVCNVPITISGGSFTYKFLN